ncbi:uncharacterized protein LOC134288719 [Aedes albopictus]|uniref:CCHC-type domain-containing protein n=1 Tax=Aedes albopictus TaxID=7160 RepID=A0ABM1YYI6_AEDAL
MQHTEEEPVGSKPMKVESGSGTKLIGTLENFVPSADFDDYLERAENFFELNEITDTTFKRKLIVHFIGLPALKKLQQLLYPQTHKDVTYEVVIEKLKSYFSSKKNRIAQSVEFFKRNQKDFEKFLDKALRDKFIAGLRNAKIQGELMNSEDGTTFDQAVTKAKNLEQIDEDLVRMKTKQEYANRINAGQYMRRSRSKTRGQDEDKRNKHGGPAKRSQSGRNQKNHGKKEYTCYGCGKKGHIIRNCWRKRNMNGLACSEDELDLQEPDYETELNHMANLPLFRKL